MITLARTLYNLFKKKTNHRREKKCQLTEEFQRWRHLETILTSLLIQFDIPVNSTRLLMIKDMTNTPDLEKNHL